VVEHVYYIFYDEVRKVVSQVEDVVERILVLLGLGNLFAIAS
jgi:hypothetical protein